ncbi:MAG TPA: ATP-binding protein [Nitrolancea sp.]|jgi:signal transduction histidine kinase|nr:ATP-binding protein [Nitrolancea sp.]
MNASEMTEQVNRATIADLQGTFLFEDYSREQLDWVLEHSEARELAAGEIAVVQDQPADAFWVLLDGEIRFSRTVGGQDVVLEVDDRPGSWGGWLPMFDKVPTISLRALQPSRVLRIPKVDMQAMLDGGFPLTKHLLIGLYGTMQNVEAIRLQQQKLAALGKLAAGLAHELNNPAAAAGRAAAQLRDLLLSQEERALRLAQQLTADDVDWLLTLKREMMERATSQEPLNPIDQSDREDELLAWLKAHGIERGWDLAPDLVTAGVGTADLEPIVARLPLTSAANAVSWLCTSLSAAALADTVEHSAGRISELVKAIKDYSYMDQAPIQDVDIHDGIENTLKLFVFKFKASKIEIVRQYDRGLPHLTVYGSELNQVWTNLMANAVEAMAPQGHGRLTIRTSREDDNVIVEISDTGPGIPRDVQSRIWEPFFTTKGVGDGTGLGLDTTRRIVVRQHHGDISVSSQPGETRFRVCLPIKQPKKA